MSVCPVKFNANGSVDVIHDDAPGGAHSSTVPIAALTLSAFLRDADGNPDHERFALVCTFAGCGSVSVHPIGGGAAAAAVQELFVRLVRRLGCPCGQLPAGRPVPVVQAHIKLNAERMDGAGRWSAGNLT